MSNAGGDNVQRPLFPSTLNESDPPLSYLAFATSPIPDFLHQLTKILKEESKDIIEWSNGQIVIHDPVKVANNVLHKYFRHSKFSSFQRQMNYFGFRKIAGKGKMSPCSYMNDSTTNDMRSLLFVKRKSCSHNVSPRVSRRPQKRDPDSNDVNLASKNTKKPRLCSDFSSSATFSETSTLTTDMSDEESTFKQMRTKAPQIQPLIMAKHIAVGTMGEMDPSDPCTLMHCESTIAFASHPCENRKSSLVPLGDDTSFIVEKFCESLNSTIQNYKRLNETDTYAGQFTSSSLLHLMQHCIPGDQNNSLMDEFPSSKSNLNSVPFEMLLEPTPISEIILNHNRA